MAKYRIQRKSDGTYTLSGTLLSDGAIAQLVTVQGVEKRLLGSEAAKIAQTLAETRKLLRTARVGGSIREAIG